MNVKQGRLFIGRFKAGDDILSSLTSFAKKNKIKLGVFQVIGAVKNARLGYYNQNKKKYVDCIKLDKKLEIASCVGNISLMDSSIFVHAHICLADHKGNSYGGHLMPGSTIFAAEYYVKELKGKSLKRKYDPETGLKLW